jgi:hypothetical protein
MVVDENVQKRIAADFQCFVCGAIFTTEQDRRQHLEKEMQESADKNDSDIVKMQTEVSEMHRQPYESL